MRIKTAPAARSFATSSGVDTEFGQHFIRVLAAFRRRPPRRRHAVKFIGERTRVTSPRRGCGTGQARPRCWTCGSAKTWSMV